MAKLTLATKRVTFVAPVPPEIDLLEREGEFTYCWRPGGLIEVLGLRIQGEKTGRAISGRELDIAEALCNGHWLVQGGRP